MKKKQADKILMEEFAEDRNASRNDGDVKKAERTLRKDAKRKKKDEEGDS